ncbi:hypothetical protein NDN08_000646 [Rhodosorus marinus]|uniref:MARVEL domain-containing protein n=1 Tax=Rhodosorus marinus TaxID=101924 RepID=A0AAV8UQ41_9RHOD|nr:hypothetical protein NDN08_000646 [Rhodosorus marinus]
MQTVDGLGWTRFGLIFLEWVFALIIFSVASATYDEWQRADEIIDSGPNDLEFTAPVTAFLISWAVIGFVILTGMLAMFCMTFCSDKGLSASVELMCQGVLAWIFWFVGGIVAVVRLNPPEFTEDTFSDADAIKSFYWILFGFSFFSMGVCGMEVAAGRKKRPAKGETDVDDEPAAADTAAEETAEAEEAAEAAAEEVEV